MMAPVHDVELPETTPEVAVRANAILQEHQLAIWRRTDRLFAGLLAFEWIAGIVLASWRSPRTWEGAVSSIHPHVWQAIFLGGVIAALPIYLAMVRPGTALTRHAVAIGQMLSSALLIHLGGGRIEMHFHVFGSLAFLAFYRDWRVLLTASAVVAADHVTRNFFLPDSIYGVLNASPWRWLEHAGWVVFEDIFLIAACLQGVRELRGIATQRALLEYSYQNVEATVRQRTAELHDTQNDLMHMARQAGMAEIATSVLHNVGNVLNSVNISVSVATSKVQDSPVKNLALAVDAMAKHKDDLGGYLTNDDQGRQIPAYLATVSEVLSDEQKLLLEEMASLTKHVEHIKQIVSVQQQYAKHQNVIENVNLATLLDDAIKVNSIASGTHGIEVVRQYAALPPFMLDKHAVLQILINLFSNAKHALVGADHDERRLTVRLSHVEGEHACVRMEIMDNGMGIDPAHLSKIFNHGFTTKKDGHGFGLHASANSAKQMHGLLTARSDGPGTGATFTLDLPILREVVES